MEQSERNMLYVFRTGFLGVDRGYRTRRISKTAVLVWNDSTLLRKAEAINGSEKEKECRRRWGLEGANVDLVIGEAGSSGEVGIGNGEGEV